MIESSFSVIRAVEKKDLEIIRKWNFNEETRRFLPPSLPVNEEEQNKWFENLLKDSAKKKFIIEHKLDNKPIGMLSIMKLDFQNQNAEVGWTIGEKDYLNKGFATDAMKYFLKYLFSELNLNMIYAMIMNGNLASLHMAEKKLHFVHTGKIAEMIFSNGKFNDMHIFCITKSIFNKYFNEL